MVTAVIISSCYWTVGCKVVEREVKDTNFYIIHWLVSRIDKLNRLEIELY